MGEPLTIEKTLWWEKARGILFCLLILFSAMLGSFYVLTPLLPLLFLNHSLWRKVNDRLIGFWLIMPSGLIEFLFGTRITVTGSKIDHSEPAIIIMNHRTRLDWLFFWNLLIRMDPWLLTSLKISLKGILKYLPGAGWAMGCNMYIFLDRTFINDSRRLESMIDYYANSGYNYQLLLFPEGTDKCPLATERSRIYAQKKGLVHYSHVLHPKTTGFAFIIKRMREAGYIKHIYDVTVAYADSIVQSELDLLRLGACPKNVHFDVRKLDINDLPEQDDRIVNWLIDLWVKKEERLQNFYSQSSISERHLDTEVGAQNFVLTPGGRAVQVSVVTFWLCLTSLWLYVFLVYPSQFLLAVLTFALFIGALVLYGGIEQVAIRAAADIQSSTRCIATKISNNKGVYNN